MRVNCCSQAAAAQPSSPSLYSFYLPQLHLWSTKYPWSYGKPITNHPTSSLSHAFLPPPRPRFYGVLRYPLATQASGSRVVAAVWAINTVCLVSSLAVAIKHWMAVADYSRALFPYTCWVGEIQVNSGTLGSMSDNGELGHLDSVSPWMNGGMNMGRGISMAPHNHHVHHISQWFMDQSVFLRTVWSHFASVQSSSTKTFIFGVWYIYFCWFGSAVVKQ